MIFNVYPNSHSLADAILDARKSTAVNKTIIVHEGNYYNTEICLTEQDSNLSIKAAENETPVLFGGRPVENWSQLNNDLWEAEFFPGDTEINMLTVDNEVAPISLLPEYGFFSHLSRFDVKWMSSTLGGWERKPTEEELTTIKVAPEDLKLWPDYKNAKLRIFHQWCESLADIDSVDANGNVKLKQVCDHPPGAFYKHDGNEKGILYQVENTIDGLTGPGKWCFRKSENKIIYWPIAGKDPNTSSIFAPTVKNILKIKGTANLLLDGISFACSGVSNEPVKFGASYASAAVDIEDAKEQLQLRNLNFNFTGGKALHIARNKGNETNCDLLVENCEIRNSGGPGIFVFNPGAKIFSNRIINIGLYYQASFALKVAGKNCEVRKNLIQNCPYTAISGGGKNAIFAENTVRDFMKKLDDGGAFYFFAGDHLQIKNNKVFGNSGRLGHAYYLDERSEECVVENNLAEETKSCFHGHMAKNCVFKNNEINDSGDTLVTFARCKDFVLENNVFNVGGYVNIKVPPQAIQKIDGNTLNCPDNFIQLLALDDEDYEVVKKAKIPIEDLVK